MKKGLLKIAAQKNCQLVGNWIGGIVCHLYFCVQHCGGNPSILKKMFLSCLQHVCNVHVECSHGPLTNQEQREIAWMNPNSMGYMKLKDFLLRPRWIRRLNKLVLPTHTSTCEVFFSKLRHALPKRKAFGFHATMANTRLQILDWNSRIVHKELTEEKFEFIYSKVMKRWRARPAYKHPQNPWPRKLMEKLLVLLSNNEPFPELEHNPWPRNSAPVECPPKVTLMEEYHKRKRFDSVLSEDDCDDCDDVLFVMPSDSECESDGT